MFSRESLLCIIDFTFPRRISSCFWKVNGHSIDFDACITQMLWQLKKLWILPKIFWWVVEKWVFLFVSVCLVIHGVTHYRLWKSKQTLSMCMIISSCFPLGSLKKKLSWKDHIPFGIVSIGECCTWLNVYVRTFYCTDLTEWLIVIKLIHQKFLVINIISYHTLLPVGYIFIPFTVFANHSFSRNMSTRRYTLWMIGL